MSDDDSLPPLPARRLKTKPRRPGSGGGAPEIDWAKHQDELIGLAKIQCTHKEAALCLGIDEDTFTGALENNLWLRNLWERGRAIGRKSLRRTQYEVAVEDKNVPMLIWLGKTELKQQEPAKQYDFVFKQMSDEQLEELVQRRLSDGQVVEAVFPEDEE